MRAVQAMRFGGPEVLVMNQVPKPVVGPGQALVDVSVADVLFLDTMIRRGAMREYFSVQPPYIPGGGVAGEVISVGEGVDEGWVGRRVVARTGQSGAYAEQVVVPADGLILVPDELSLREAAA